MNIVLEARELSKEYRIGPGEAQQVLKSCSLKVEAGEFLSVMGASGSGKSTLLYNISGMDRPTSGTAVFNGTAICQMAEKKLAKLRLERMGFVFQQNHFLKNLNIFDNIVLPAYLNGKEDRKDINAHAKALMEQTGILPLMDRDITQVSGGQLQRASICRALINRPEILFADEPTGALNSRAAAEVMEILGRINAGGTAIMLVTHDPKVAAKSERVLFMSDGSLTGELRLGKYHEQSDLRERERRLSEWLLRRGF